MSDSSAQRVLIVGGSSGIALDLTRDLLHDGVDVVLGTRNPERTTAALPNDVRAAVTVTHVDLGAEDSIAAVHELGPFDHVVSVAAAHANGPVPTLGRTAILTAFDAKVIGPILLAKHLSDSIRPGGSFIFFSGVAAWKPAPGLAVMATTNGAVSFLVDALAVELAPVRAIAVSPGIIDSGAWDGLGDDAKTAMFEQTAAANPARRIGATADIVSAVRFAMANTFVTGTTLHVDGGGHLS